MINVKTWRTENNTIHIIYETEEVYEEKIVVDEPEMELFMLMDCEEQKLYLENKLQFL